MDPRIPILDPDDVTRYEYDFSQRVPVGDTLASCTVALTLGTAELANAVDGTFGATSAAAVSGYRATVWIKNAVAPQIGVKFHATTATGRQLDQTIGIQVADR